MSDEADRPRVSLVVPAYNEAALIERTLQRLQQHMSLLEDRYDWELIVVDDGSTDRTADLAEAYAEAHPNMRVLRHPANLGLGQALRYAFDNCRGDYVVTIDCDLSYDPEHIERLVATAEESRARIVLTSVFARGGRIVNVPWRRRTLSLLANRYLRAAAGSELTTLTGMVRCYDRKFLRKLSLRSMGAEINTEIIYKAQLMGARIVEIPAELNWTFEDSGGVRRPSPVRTLRNTSSYLQAGFLFRPATFIVVAGVGILATAMVLAVWVGWLAAVVGLVVAIHSVGIGALALQSRRYFEALYDLGVRININTCGEQIIVRRPAVVWSSRSD